MASICRNLFAFIPKSDEVIGRLNNRKKKKKKKTLVGPRKRKMSSSQSVSDWLPVEAK